jgi:hypothetical protein
MESDLACLIYLYEQEVSCNQVKHEKMALTTAKQEIRSQTIMEPSENNGLF